MTSGSQKDKTPSQLIDERIEQLDDWRGSTLAKLRSLVKQADPDVVEEWKWRGVPTWYHDGMICTGETYKSIVKMTFAKGAALEDPSGLFNSSLEGNVAARHRLSRGREDKREGIQGAHPRRCGAQRLEDQEVEDDAAARLRARVVGGPPRANPQDPSRGRATGRG